MCSHISPQQTPYYNPRTASIVAVFGSQDRTCTQTWTWTWLLCLHTARPQLDSPLSDGREQALPAAAALRRVGGVVVGQVLLLVLLDGGAAAR